jgi:inorganic phosphate transporter, PiT family
MLMLITFLIGVGLALFNGANDNGKPVATLIGSGIASLRQGLGWGFWTTLAGSLCAVIWGATLLKAFSGQGLVALDVTAKVGFLPAVALGASMTVALATKLKLPISTTHALLGGLVGAGLVLGQGHIAWNVLGVKLAGPLLISPIAGLLTALLLVFPLRLFAPKRVMGEGCVCIAPSEMMIHSGGSVALRDASIKIGTLPECKSSGGFMVLPPLGKIVRGLHVLSSGAVSFARGLNDTPKIAAILLPVAFLSKSSAVLAVSVAMGLGGWFLSRGVAVTMSEKITDLKDRELDAFAANVSTAFLVLLASRWGLPVSTTHVSTGSLVGTGLSHGEFQGRTLATILLAWITTLPMAAGIAGLVAFLLRHA